MAPLHGARPGHSPPAVERDRGFACRRNGVPLADYLVGQLFFVATMAAVGTSAWLVARRTLSQLAGAPRLLAIGTLWTVGVIVVHVLPAALGVLSRETTLAASVLVLLMASALGGGPGKQVSPPPPPAAPSSRLSWMLAAAAVAMFALYVLGFLYERALVPVTAQDFTGFHLPGIATVMRSGTLWHLVDFFPLYATGAYPHNGDVMFLAAVLPWKNDAFVRLVNYPFLAMIGIAVYAIACELRAPRAAAVLFAVVAMTVRVVAVPAIEQLKPEPTMLASFGTGVLFLLRHFRTRARSELVLAGIAFGVAFGARWNGMLAVAAVLVLYGIGSWLTRRGLRTVVQEVGVLTALTFAGGGVWLMRNLIETGNPVFPFKVAALGFTVFDAPPDPVRKQFGYSVLDYIGSARLRDDVLGPAYGLALGAPGLVLAVALLVAVVVALAAADRRRIPVAEAGRVIALALAAMIVVAVYASTALSAVGFRGKPQAAFVVEAARWAMPAVVLAAPAAAWLAGRVGRWRVVLELAALAAVAHATYKQARSFDIAAGSLVITGAAVAAAAACVAGAHTLRGRLDPVRRRWAAAGALAVGLASFVLAGHLLQQGFNERRYVGYDATLDWVIAYAPAGHRIGVAGDANDVGVQPNLPLFGPRLGNHVVYVGRHVRGILRRYDSPSAFVGGVRRGRYDLVLIGRGIPSGPLKSGTPPELVGALQAGFQPLALSPSFELFRVTLGPARRAQSAARQPALNPAGG
jgi:hypothetical protein